MSSACTTISLSMGMSSATRKFSNMPVTREKVCEGEKKACEGEKKAFRGRGEGRRREEELVEKKGTREVRRR